MFPDLGESVLDTPIKVLAPGYNFTLGDRYRSERVSFRDLLAHRVCTHPDSVGVFVGDFKNSQELFYRQRYAPTACSIRNGYHYNNALVAMAGDVIAFMAKSTYNEMLEELLLRINMTSTTYIKDSDDHNNIPGRSVPYYWKEERLIRYNTELMKTVVIANAAGGILSSSQDIAKYMQFHKNLGKVGEDQIVGKDAMKWLTKVSTLYVDGPLKTEDNPDTSIDLNVGYALCLQAGVYDGWLRVSHQGYLPPYESQMSLYPGQGLGVFTTSSGPGLTLFTANPMNIVHNKIFDILQGKGRKITGSSSSASVRVSGPFIVPQMRSKVEVTSAKDNFNINLAPEDIIGNFGNGLNGQINITLKTNGQGDEQAYMEYGIWGKGWLNQTSQTRFEIQWETDFWQIGWTNQLGENVWMLIFLDQDTLQYFQDGVLMADNFVRDVTLNNLPEIPWSPDSCGDMPPP